MNQQHVNKTSNISKKVKRDKSAKKEHKKSMASML